MARRLVESDDEIYQYDRTFLGPPDLPWLQLIEARYVTWGIWFISFVVLVIPLEILFGKTPADAIGQVVWAMGLAGCLAWLISSRIDREKPVPAVLQGLYLPRLDALACALDRRRAGRAVGRASTPAGRTRYPVLESATGCRDIPRGALTPTTRPGPKARESARAWKPGRDRMTVVATSSPERETA